MAEPFEIHITEEAEADLAWFKAYARRTILDGCEKTRNRLLLRGQEFSTHESGRA